MRRNIGCHTDGNTAGSVAQQIRHCSRHNNRFLFFTVISIAEINRVFIQTVHQGNGKLGESGLGITHGRRTVAVNIAEVALPVHQRIPHRKILRQTAHRPVNRAVAVRVVLTDDVADHAGTFLKPRFRIQMQLPHGIQEPAMHRFQAVAHIRQRPRNDCRHRVRKIAAAQLFGQGHGFNFLFCFSH